MKIELNRSDALEPLICSIAMDKVLSFSEKMTRIDELIAERIESEKAVDKERIIRFKKELSKSASQRNTRIAHDTIVSRFESNPHDMGFNQFKKAVALTKKSSSIL